MVLRRGRVVHQIPGRVRVRLSDGDLTQEAVETLHQALLGMTGVKDVRLAPRGVSVVITYDPSALDVANLGELARAANVLVLDADANGYAVGNVEPSQVTQTIQRTFHEMDARLADLTKRRWDLRTVTPVAIGVLALRQLMQNPGQLGSAPWYVLAWYAFDSFLKLNPPSHLGADSSRPTPDGGEDA